jgi:hypothetical protein
MITIALRKRTLSPVRLVLKVTFFCCYMPQWCHFVFWGSFDCTSYMLMILLYLLPLVKAYLLLQMPSISIYASSVSSCTSVDQAKRARRRPCTVRRGMRSTELATLRTWVTPEEKRRFLVRRALGTKQRRVSLQYTTQP